MMEIINLFSTLDDLLIVAGVVMFAYGLIEIGLASVILGLGIMFAKGEILVPVP